MPKKCPVCGGKVKLSNAPRIEKYKGINFVITDPAVPTCEDCGESFLNKQLCEELDKTLKDKYNV